IRVPEMNEIDQGIREQLEAVKQKTGEVGEIAKMLALRPDIYNATTAIFVTLMVRKTELDPHTKERIAILVSKENGCDMCVGEHERIARMLGMPQEQIDETLAGVDKMNIADKERVLLQFCIKSAGKENYKIVQGDIDKLRAAGYSDSQILEAVAIVGYFNYINTISNALGAGK
ncbi:MAG: carboxymuconolactone decarboxylase family protein, partial [Deltaproteobacteria bacterium]